MEKKKALAAKDADAPAAEEDGSPEGAEEQGKSVTIVAPDARDDEEPTARRDSGRKTKFGLRTEIPKDLFTAPEEKALSRLSYVQRQRVLGVVKEKRSGIEEAVQQGKTKQYNFFCSHCH